MFLFLLWGGPPPNIVKLSVDIIIKTVCIIVFSWSLNDVKMFLTATFQKQKRSNIYYFCIKKIYKYTRVQEAVKIHYLKLLGVTDFKSNKILQ